MGSVGSTTVIQPAPATPDYTQDPEYRRMADGITDFRKRYANSEEMRQDGYKAVNDFSLSTFFREGNIVTADYDPADRITKVYVWDPDWKRWMKAAEKDWRKWSPTS